MATALRPLQTAIYARLDANPLLAGRVHSDLPEQTAYPCVQIGTFTEVPDDAHDAQGLDTLAVVHVWSMAPGNGEIFDFLAAVDAALDRVPLAVTGFRDVGIKRVSSQVVPDPDPDVKHINAQFRIHMSKETP